MFVFTLISPDQDLFCNNFVIKVCQLALTYVHLWITLCKMWITIGYLLKSCYEMWIKYDILWIIMDIMWITLYIMWITFDILWITTNFNIDNSPNICTLFVIYHIAHMSRVWLFSYMLLTFTLLQEV